MEIFLIAMSITFGIGLVGVVNYQLHARRMSQLDHERFMYELEQQRFQSYAKMVEQVNFGTAKTTADILKDAVVEVVKGVSEAMGSALTPVVMPKVIQPELGPEGDPTSPVWTEWDDVTKAVTDFGVGDSVVLDRDYESVDRVAMIGDGESIIPGLALPDMTGEEFNG